MTQQAAAPKIRVRNLSVGYDGTLVQERVSFDVKAGSIFAIMGVSGTGKSTILRAMIGLLRPSAGDICFDDVNYW